MPLREREVLERYEFRNMVRILDAVQIHTDYSVYCGNNPRSGESNNSAKAAVKVLSDIFHPYDIDNHAIHAILEHVYQNYVQLARELLPLYETEIPHDSNATSPAGPARTDLA